MGLLQFSNELPNSCSSSSNSTDTMARLKRKHYYKMSRPWFVFLPYQLFIKYEWFFFSQLYIFMRLTRPFCCLYQGQRVNLLKFHLGCQPFSILLPVIKIVLTFSFVFKLEIRKCPQCRSIFSIFWGVNSVAYTWMTV